jgi:hypothetical protein
MTDEEVFERIETIATEMDIAPQHRKSIEWLFDNISDDDRPKHPKFKDIMWLLKVAIVRKL